MTHICRPYLLSAVYTLFWSKTSHPITDTRQATDCVLTTRVRYGDNRPERQTEASSPGPGVWSVSLGPCWNRRQPRRGKHKTLHKTQVWGGNTGDIKGLAQWSEWSVYSAVRETHLDFNQREMKRLVTAPSSPRESIPTLNTINSERWRHCSTSCDVTGPRVGAVTLAILAWCYFWRNS